MSTSYGARKTSMKRQHYVDIKSFVWPTTTLKMSVIGVIDQH